jgi:LysM repeat protein
MIGCAPLWRLLLFLFLSVFFAGCSQLRRSSLDEEKEPHFIEGKKRGARFDWDGAIDSFGRALQVNPHNASAHLELGVLYDTKKNDYASAIYHYQRHLTLRTNSPMADVVKQNMTACTRELAKTVQYAVVSREVQRDLERYEQTNSLLRRRIEFLEAELARRPQYVTNYITNFVGLPQFDQRSSARLTQPTQPLTPRVEPEEAPPARQETRSSNQRTVAQRPSNANRESSPPSREQREAARPSTRKVHTVRPGETLAVLARRYGVSLEAMKAANPSAARGVRAGQKITVP